MRSRWGEGPVLLGSNDGSQDCDETISFKMRDKKEMDAGDIWK